MAQEKIVIFHEDERGAVTNWDEIGDLVRCKDCIHNGTSHFGPVEFWACEKMVGNLNMREIVSGDDYCSRGERRVEG